MDKEYYKGLRSLLRIERISGYVMEVGGVYLLANAAVLFNESNVEDGFLRLASGLLCYLGGRVIGTASDEDKRELEGLERTELSDRLASN